jgi:hypothetical protein
MPAYRLESPEGKIVDIEYDGDLTEDVYNSIMNDPSVRDRGLTRDEFYNKWNKDKQKKFSTKAVEFAGGVIEGGKGLVDTLWEGVKASPELLSKKGLKTAQMGGIYGTLETGKMVADIWGELVDFTVSPEEEMEREYQRHLRTQDFEREKQGLLESGDVNRELFNASNVILDATNITGAGIVKAGGTAVVKGVTRKLTKAIPVKAAAWGARKAVKGGEAVEWVASRPRKMVQAAAKKLTEGMDSKRAQEIQSRVMHSYHTVAFGGAAASGLGALDSIPYVPGLMKGLGAAEITSRAMPLVNTATQIGAEAIDVLSKPSTHRRFLDKLATDSDLFKSMPWARNLPRIAHKYGGTKLAEKSFDMLVDGASIGTMQATLAFASGADAREAGQAFGGGAIVGGGASLTTKGRSSDPTLDSVFKGEKPTAESLNVVNGFAEKIGNDLFKKDFKELPIQAQTVIASMDEFGIKRDGMNTEIIPDKLYDEMYRESGRNRGELAFYDPESNALLINRDKIKKANPNQIIEQIYGRYVESHLKSVMDYDLSIASDFESFFSDPKGIDIKRVDGTTVKLSSDIIDFKNKYNDSVGENAKIEYSGEILSEIGSRMLAQNLISGKNPKTPIGAKIMSSSVGKFLNMVGILDGNFVKKQTRMANFLLKNEKLSELYNRHVELQNQSRHLLSKQLDNYDKEITLGNLKKTRPNLKTFEDKNKKATIKQVRDGLLKIGERHSNIDEFVGLGRDFASGRLSPEVFDLYGNLKNGEMHLDRLRLIQDAMDNNKEGFFGYANQVVLHDRDWIKPRGWTPFFWEISDSGKNKGRLKFQGYDTASLKMNVNRLIENGVITGTNAKAYMEFIKDVAEEIKKNPEIAERLRSGKIEDDILSVLFGMPVDKVSDATLKATLSKSENKLRKVIRSAFVDDVVAFDVGGRGFQLPYFDMYYN